MSKEEKITDDIIGQQYDDYWNHMIKNDIMYGNVQTIDSQQLNDLSIIKHDHGKIKLKKHNKGENKAIKIGDRVNNNGKHGEVIDIDGDLLCVKTVDGEIRVWNINNVNS